MRASNGSMGIVPAHPMDVRGKSPLNLSQGFYAVTTRGVTGQITPQSDARWKVENKPGREVMQNQLAAVSAPVRVSRMMSTSPGTGGRGTAGTAGSTIVFDRNEGRFVNSPGGRAGDSTPVSASTGARLTKETAEQTQPGMKISPPPNRSGNGTRVPPAGDRMNGREGPGRQAPPAARNTPPPPSVPRAVTNERVFNQGNAGQGGRSMGPAGAGATGGAGAPRASAPSAGASSGGARSSGGSTGGGRPH